MTVIKGLEINKVKQHVRESLGTMKNLTSNERGGTKTAVVGMLALLVVGVTASSWSDANHERQQANNLLLEQNKHPYANNEKELEMLFNSESNEISIGDANINIREELEQKTRIPMYGEYKVTKIPENISTDKALAVEKELSSIDIRKAEGKQKEYEKQGFKFTITQYRVEDGNLK